MSLFDRIFGKADDSAAAPEAQPEVQIVDAETATANAGKIKLNFKKLPKKVVQAMADETTGQEIDRPDDEEDKRRRGGQSGGLSDAFNGAAAARAAAVARDRDFEMERMRPAMAPPRPRMPSPSP